GGGAVRGPRRARSRVLRLPAAPEADTADRTRSSENLYAERLPEVHRAAGWAQSPSRSGRKKARTSSARSSGSSMDAKWPPRGISVQRRTSETRATPSRGGAGGISGGGAHP